MKVLLWVFAAAWSVTGLAQPTNFDAVQIKTTKITDTIYMLEGEGGNIGVSAGDDITVHHIPPAHTDGDSFVRFRNANVIHTGDVFAAYRYPFIDVENGGSVKGIVKAMDALLPTLDEHTKVIPGHGPLSGKKDV